MTAILTAWRESADEPQELSHGSTLGVEHGWWVDRRTFALGVGVTRETESPLWPNRLAVAVELGPLQWGASREWRRGE